MVRTKMAESPPPGSGLRLSFANSRGLRLAGRLLLPPGRGPHPVIVFAHGWGSSKDSPGDRVLTEALRGQGFAALLFDFTGHGESDGEASGLADQVDDLGAALTLLEMLDEVDAGRMGVLGASSGAAVALLRAPIDPRIRALALRSGSPSGAEHAASDVSIPTLLVVSERDEPIRAGNEALVKRLGGPSRLEVIATGDHLCGDPATLPEAADTIVAWFTAHLRRS